MATKKKKTNPPKRKLKFNVALFKDSRVKRISGLALLLVVFICLVSMVSYFFTYKADYSLVTGTANPNDLFEYKNAIGRFGAWVSHQFMHVLFGPASFILLGYLTALGIEWISPKKLFNLKKIFWHSLVLTLFFSLVLAFIKGVFSPNGLFPLGGAFGNTLTGETGLLIGNLKHIGTVGVLVFMLLGYLTWAFNIDLGKLVAGLFQAKAKPKKESVHHVGVDDTLFEKDKIEPKVQSTVTPVAQPTTEIKEEEGSLDFEVKTTDDDGFEIVEPKTPTKTTAKPQDEDLELTVAEVVEEKIIEKKTIETEYDPTLDLSNYKFPTLDLLEEHGTEKISINKEELERNKNQIVETLRNYKIEIEKIKATIGPTVTLYEIVPAPGIRISKIKNLEDDIALSLAALGIRIIAPIPGKGTIGIEVPNANKETVSIRSVLSSEKFRNTKFELPIALGKTISNEIMVANLAKMPHLLMAGATGQGKSVGINTILVSLLYKKHPSQLKFVLVDPKKVELSIYTAIKNHYLATLPGEEEPIITDVKKVVNTVNALCVEMDQRYDLLKNARARNIKEYNQKFKQRQLNPEKGHRFLPYIVLVIDEFADLIMTAGKEVELPIARLAQLARAIGIHLILATQRPSVNIITGIIKANFPARISFKVTSKIDSRTILDAGGADQLIGRGDLLYSIGSDITRVQCAFVDTPEVERIADFIHAQQGYPNPFELPEYVDPNAPSEELGGYSPSELDPLFKDAARLIVLNQQGSTSMLQRKLSLGYNRAGRIMDQLESLGIVGPSQGSKAREVLYHTEAELEQYLQNLV